MAVIDGDMQHDEAALPAMVAAVADEAYDLAVGSRYTEGGGFGNWTSDRQRISRVATRLAGLVLKTPIGDPMSGFFVIRRTAFDAAMPKLSGLGFKILIDLIASSPRALRTKEVPYEFRTRVAGESKLDSAVASEYLMLLLDKLIGHIVPVRFMMFAAVGTLGLGVHLTVLALMLKWFDQSFTFSQSTAVMMAMTFNFLVNNVLTYRDRRLRGRRLFTGLLSFYAVCLVGAVANVGVGRYIYASDAIWWEAGLAGAVVGAVWNYATSAVVTWRPSNK
jgi:dolichol-phosphate mannosyltransferase